MDTRDWEKPISKLTLKTHTLSLASLAAILGIYFAFPPSAEAWEGAIHQMIFYVFAFLAAGTLVVSWWMYEQLLSLYSLEMRIKGVGFPSAVESFGSGIMLSAILGAVCAMLGVAFYAMSREPNRLGVFLAAWGIHYILATLWLRKGREDLERLAQDAQEEAESIQSAM